MYKLAMCLIILPISTLIISSFMLYIDPFLNWIDICIKSYKQRKEIDKKIKIYKEVYKNETDNFEKGYWFALISNLHYERNRL